MTRAPAAIVLFMWCSCGCASGLNRPVVSVDAKPDAQGVQHVDVDMHSFYFEPNRIVVHAKQPVDLTIRNRSIFVPHNFSIHATGFMVDVDKWGLGSAHARFTAPEPGEYRFFCHVDEHGKKKGMTGTLVVVP